jgi:hypothetical protein
MLVRFQPGAPKLKKYNMSFEKPHQKKKELPRVPPTERVIDQPLGDVVDDLYMRTVVRGHGSVTESPREYRIQRSVTPQDLEKLGLLPFEVLLVEHDAGLTLSTGLQFKGWATEQSKTRDMKEARYTIHNHPSEAIPFPSATVTNNGDVGASELMPSAIDVIVGRDGITFHKQDFTKNMLSNKALDLRRVLAGFRGDDHALTMS